MTLEEMKIKTYSLIEEYNEDEDNLTEDNDLATKMNSVINQIQNEICRYKKINAFITKEVKKDDIMTLTDIDENIYQLNIIKDVDYEQLGDTIIFNEDGTAKILYYKYPTQINNDTPDNYKFELTNDALEIMSYGVAGDLLKSDVSSNYGQIYSKRYESMLQGLDPRNTMSSFFIDGGINV